MKTFVVVPNWNGGRRLEACLDSLRRQSTEHEVIVVDNGSVDISRDILLENKEITTIWLDKNHGFAGGVNAGIRQALAQRAKYVALLNNDAQAEPQWLEKMIETIESDPKIGIVAPKMLSGGKIDSTGECYSIWGLPFPRGRDLPADDKRYDDENDVLAASGGASLYRTKMLQSIGLFDEDFFAYYEDVDISFRAQLAGWRIVYAPTAVVQHEIGGTSGKIPGFITYHSLKNLPWLTIKNLPLSKLIKVAPRLMLVYFSFIGKALLRGQFVAVIKALSMNLLLLPKKLWQRWSIQSSKTITAGTLWQKLYQDLPPGAGALRKLRSTLLFWKEYDR